MERQTITGSLSTSGRLSGALSAGGGTTDYNELENKPTYNGHIIEGDLTSEILGIWQPKNFSTEEQNTGLKWIDGKDIYIKCYQTKINNSDNVYVDMNLNNSLIQMLPMSSIAIDTKGIYNATYTVNIYTNCYLRLFCNYLGVGVNCDNYSNNFGESTLNVVLYYTKITN